MARPEPLTPVGAPVQGGGAPSVGAAAGTAASGNADAPPASAIPEAEQFFAPAVLQPAQQFAPAPWSSSPSSLSSPYGSAESSGAVRDSAVDSGKWIIVVGVVIFVIAAVATAYVTFGGAKKAQTPVALPPKAPTAGLPTSLEAIVRIEAESSRRNALQAVEQLGGADVGRLAAIQPNYTWVSSNDASKDPHTVSVGQLGTAVTIAVSAANKDICAYGEWAPGGTPVYVTMAHEPSCSASTAPPLGPTWSTEPGGAASDLPDDNVG